MTNVAKWMRLATPPPVLDRKCDFGKYTGWHWKTIIEKDPKWILWLVTESSYLLPREIESALTKELRNLTPEE